MNMLDISGGNPEMTYQGLLMHPGCLTDSQISSFTVPEPILWQNLAKLIIGSHSLLPFRVFFNLLMLFFLMLDSSILFLLPSTKPKRTCHILQPHWASMSGSN